MRVSVVIDCHNYEEYIAEAITSVINQKRQPDEIIIVDDGSTDNSLKIIKKTVDGIDFAKVISQKNQGQLACIHRGIIESSGDVVFFLDADDMYKEDHISSCINIFQNKTDVGFIFTAHENFGRINNVRRQYSESTDLGFSVISTLFSRAYIGSVTSTLSVKREVLSSFTPIPEQLIKDWPNRGETCIVWGASAAGAKKYFSAKPTVLRRIHDNNRSKLRSDISRKYFYYLGTDRYLKYLKDKFGYTSQLVYKFDREFRTNSKPTMKNVKNSIKYLNRMPMEFHIKVKLFIKCLLHYFSARKSLK